MKKTHLIGINLLLMVWINSVFAVEAGSRPNILLILTDDHGYADVGFNKYSSKDVKSPNLDDLAKNGVIFESAYVAHPFCGPSRAALLTGRYPHKIGAQFNLPAEGSDLGVDVKEQYISKTLKDAGYFTGALGKWHLGHAPEYHPNARGFDEYYGFLGGGHRYFPSEYQPIYDNLKKRGVQNINEYLTPLEHNGKEVKETEYVTDALSREAVNFVNKAKGMDKPFFLYLAYNAPHTPLEAKEDDLKLFTHIKDKKRRTYAAMVYAVDRGVAKVVNALKENKQYENTIIVFLSDNGGKLTQGGVNTPLKEGKGSAHEGGHRVPMMIHWPNVVEAGRTYTHPITAIDLYPTFVSLAGAKLPVDKVLDGVDFLPYLNTDISARPGKDVYVMRHRGGAHDVSVRRDQYKAVRTVKTNKWQLFDVVTDMGEKHDISSEHPQLLQDMVNGMAYWSWTNIQPKWFHIHQEGDAWRKDAMPRFGETFELKN